MWRQLPRVSGRQTLQKTLILVYVSACYHAADRMDGSDGRTDQWRGREELELLNHFKSRESPGAENTVRSEVPGGTVPGRYWYEYRYSVLILLYFGFVLYYNISILVFWCYRCVAHLISQNPKSGKKRFSSFQ